MNQPDPDYEALLDHLYPESIGHSGEYRTPKFMVEFVGEFYTSTLYDRGGKEVFTIEEAAEAAEEMYGSSWACVYNGEEAISRDEWKGTDE